MSSLTTAMCQHVTNPHDENQYLPNITLRPLARKHSPVALEKTLLTTAAIQDA